MRDFSRALQIYMLVVVTAGAAILFFAVPRALGDIDTAQLILFGTLAICGILAGIYRVPMANSHVRMDLTSPVLLMAVMLSTSSRACVLTALVSLVSGILTRRRPRSLLFNAAVEVLGIGLAGSLYHGLAQPDLLPLDSPQTGLAFFFAASAYWLVNSLLIMVLAASYNHDPLAKTIAKNYADMYLQMILMTLLALLGAAAWHQGPLYALILFVPTAVIYQLLTVSKVKQEQVIHAAEIIAEVLDRRNPFTFQHSRRVADLTLKLARRVGLTQADCLTLHRAALIHDIGKLGVDDHRQEFAPKADLTDYQFYNLKQHAQLGAMIAREIPAFEEAEEPIRYHHDWYDGTRVSKPHAREEIPIGARIIAVADSYDLLCMANGEATLTYDPMAVEELHGMSDKQLDPRLLAAFLEILQAERDETVPVSGVGQTAAAG